MLDYNVLVYLAVAISIIWATTLSFIEKKRALLFLPFLFFGIINSFRGAFAFLKFYDVIIFTFMDVTYIALLIWIFVNIIKRRDSNDTC